MIKLSKKLHHFSLLGDSQCTSALLKALRRPAVYWFNLVSISVDLRIPYWLKFFTTLWIILCKTLVQHISGLKALTVMKLK